jgi:hypothetical protein
MSEPQIKVTGSYSSLIQNLRQLPAKLDALGANWTAETAEEAKARYVENLKEGHKKPLFPSSRGRLRDQIFISYRKEKQNWIATMGFPDDWSTAAAITQDKGATISVSDEMRNKFASHGIPLREETKFIDIPGTGDWSNAMEDIELHGQSRAEQLFLKMMKELFG